MITWRAQRGQPVQVRSSDRLGSLHTNASLVHFGQMQKPEYLHILQHDATLQVTPFIRIEAVSRFGSGDDHDDSHGRASPRTDVHYVAKADRLTGRIGRAVGHAV